MKTVRKFTVTLFAALMLIGGTLPTLAADLTVDADSHKDASAENGQRLNDWIYFID